MSLKHPETIPPLLVWEKWSSTRPVLGAKKFGECCPKGRPGFKSQLCSLLPTTELTSINSLYSTEPQLLFCKGELVTQLCPTLGDSMDCSPPGSSAHGIFQARILEWVAISVSRGSSLTQGLNPVSSLQAYILASESPGKPFVKGQ